MQDPKTREQIEKERQDIDVDFEKFIDQHGNSEEANQWRDAAYQAIDDQINGL